MTEPGAAQPAERGPASGAGNGIAGPDVPDGPDAPADPADLLARARAGSPRALARLVSLAENGSPLLRQVMAAVAPLTGHASIVGLTGPPGAGKSTVTGALVAAYRKRDLRVGVLAVDPTSPFTGGALLGDRVRMQEHATDSGVFIRSMASRGHLGGLAVATPQAARILDAAGFDVILIETVGVGQAEVEVASLADSTLVVLAPGMGDSVQAAKAGVLEAGDIFVVNKCDRPGAQETVRDLRTMIAMAHFGPEDWKPPIVMATAIAGEGTDELAARLDAHWAWLATSGERDRRRVARASAEVSAIAVAVLRERLGAVPDGSRLSDLAVRVARGEMDVYSAADKLTGG